MWWGGYFTFVDPGRFILNFSLLELWGTGVITGFRDFLTAGEQA